VVGVVGIETVEQDFHLVSMIVAVGVLEQHQERFLREVDSFGGQFETDRHVQSIGKDGFFVRASVAVGVFVDQDHVVGFGVTRFVVWVTRQGRDPQTTFVVKSHLGS